MLSVLWILEHKQQSKPTEQSKSDDNTRDSVHELHHYRWSPMPVPLLR